MKQPVTKKKTILPKIIGFLAVSLGLIQIIIANQTASSGLKVKNFDETVNILESENRRLENQIAKETSLTVIYKKAKSLGFKTQASFIFYTSPLPVAYKSGDR